MANPSCNDAEVSISDGGPRWIALEGAVNARAVVPGVLLRSDNLQSLSARDVRVLLDEEGVETVLDLRTDVEVQLEGPGPMTREPAVRIEHRSLYPDSGGNTDFEVDTVKPWQLPKGDEFSEELPIVRAYLSYLRRRPDSVVGSIRTMARADGAVLVHCAAGKDRTGVVVALALTAAGVRRDAVVADYVATGERMSAVLDRLRSSPTYAADIDSRPTAAADDAPRAETMAAFLDQVGARYGGVLAWLSGHGFGPQDVRSLRIKLLGAG